VSWAELIFAMEDKHRRRLVEEFAELLHGKPVYVLDIADEYGYMDAELVEMLTQTVGDILRFECQ
jgi:predicted protein tyrosine phosphatase